MSNDQSPTGDGGQGDGGKSRQRRRRRRRKPDEASGGERSSGASQGSGAGEARSASKPEGRGTGEARSPASGGGDRQARGDGDRKPRRRRRRGARDEGGPPEAERAGPGRARGPREVPGERPTPARRARNEGRAPGARTEPPGSAPATPPAGPPDVDGGWDTSSPVAPPQRSEAPEPRPDDGRWGDDSDAPTPDIRLESDLPADPPADDPDPLTRALEDAPPDLDLDELPQVKNVVGIKFASAGKIYLYDAGDAAYQRGERVVVAGDRGQRIGEVAVPSVRRVHERGRLERVLRRPNDSDHRSEERNAERGNEAVTIARDAARELRLPIKVFRAEYAHSGNKVMVYFTCEERVDFRELVRVLTQKLGGRVEMRQTGVRDQAKLVGGIGSCGQTLCCTTWLPEFVPVSIKMAKDQGLSLNPQKVSGQCGRLKCCLVYEQETYATMRKGMPKLGKRVVTPEGEGRVVEVDVLRQRLRVSLVSGDHDYFPREDVQPLFAAQNQPKGGADPKR